MRLKEKQEAEELAKRDPKRLACLDLYEELVEGLIHDPLTSVIENCLNEGKFKPCVKNYLNIRRILFQTEIGHHYSLN